MILRNQLCVLISTVSFFVVLWGLSIGAPVCALPFDASSVQTVNNTYASHTTMNITYLPALVRQHVRQALGDDLQSTLQLSATSQLARDAFYGDFQFIDFAKQFLGLETQVPDSSYIAFSRCMHKPRAIDLTLKRMCRISVVTPATCFQLVLRLVEQNEHRFRPISYPLRINAAFFIAGRGDELYGSVIHSNQWTSGLNISLYHAWSRAVVYLDLIQGKIPTPIEINYILSKSPDRQFLAAKHIYLRLLQAFLYHGTLASVFGTDSILDGLINQNPKMHIYVADRIYKQLIHGYGIKDVADDGPNLKMPKDKQSLPLYPKILLMLTYLNDVILSGSDAVN